MIFNLHSHGIIVSLYEGMLSQFFKKGIQSRTNEVLEMYDHILVALDGSEPSRFAGQTAVALAAATSARLTACHVYGAEIHRRRFTEMEPGLPTKYQEQETLSTLRTAHDSLMHKGFQALSEGYVEDFVKSSRDSGIVTQAIASEGRSYVGILHLAEKHRADLIVLGAEGLGAVGNGMLGGTTSRVLDGARCDVLVARRMLHGGPVLTGVDGSGEALKAVAKATAIGRAMDKPLYVVAAYDPDFHTRVFGAMARSLSPQRQDQVGLASQEKLHNEIINDGLGKLYKEFLHEAERRFSTDGVALTTFLKTGKAYCVLNLQARNSDVDLIVVNRHGLHRQSCSRLGSNAEGLIRTTSTNVLLVGGVDDVPSGPKHVSESAEISTEAQPLIWDSDAEARLQRVPSFVRRMARRTVENAVRELGKNRVSAEDFAGVAARFGMGQRRNNT
ncbi:MAG: universal stress protein [Planctomycetota bacterium]